MNCSEIHLECSRPQVTNLFIICITFCGVKNVLINFFVQHLKSAERSSELLMLLSHVGWQMWSGVIIWLYQICQVATLLPPPQRVLYFTLTLQPQSKWIRT